MGWTTCYIGLGGNIANEHGTPKEHLQNAIHAFQHSEYFSHVATSSLYSSKAYGVTDQPDFVNAVLKADTSLAPLDLLDFCQTLENTAGRVRLRHWGERCLDVDVLLYGDETIHHDRLIVPHRELLLRNFVVIPLLEIAPDLVVNGQQVKELAVASDWGGLIKNV
ncbi:MAG: 2-amino-4-hydroxy-6-hydroxymethyldihydropteridine diphosphokinase [Moraxella sp.]|uniref:2-amino-4-hydroxy-6- hydroxymethyldihydropteridine diphosphokinase n=1 Tax=Moraxella sp. TaxID=479 RepID=UPI0026DC9F6E|nr:2-amino-4-hydroxy-6-hydroxymethyldihydropteridine diphosphokinase [Moraxella sp.]MDO4449555.1 2-amino-4-hydroxy-6-hydroxymethyldihydropteridine diphosphokinase [Moraxella sp.]